MMVDNNSAFYVANDSLFNVSGITLISDGNEVLNVIQPDLQNNTIIVTPEQLESLGIQLDTTFLTNTTPVIEVNEKNLTLTQEKPSLKRPLKLNNAKTQNSLRNSYQKAVDPDLLNFVSINIPHYETQITRQGYESKTTKINNYAPVSEAPNKIVYRILHPEELRLTENKKIEKKIIDQIPQTELKVYKPKGRPTKPKDNLSKELNGDKKEELVKEIDKEEDVITVKPVRTRFGRITKPPQHLQGEKDVSIETDRNTELSEPHRKQIRLTLPNEESVTSSTQLNYETDNTNKPNPSIAISDTPLNNIDQSQTEITFNSIQPKIHKRKIASSKFLCKACNKFYLGRARMKKHLQLNPDHKLPKQYEPNNRLWLDIIERTLEAPKNDQASAFLGELSNVLQKVRTMVPKALKPVVHGKESNSCQIDNHLSSLLGVPEGKYNLDINLLNTEYSVTNQNEISNNSNLNISENCNVLQSLLEPNEENSHRENGNILEENLVSDHSRSSTDSDNAAQTSLLSLLDTGQVNFDTSDSAHASEAVRCVDQLVNERLSTLTGVELSNHSTTPNITLDLSMDMFTYPS